MANLQWRLAAYFVAFLGAAGISSANTAEVIPFSLDAGPAESTLNDFARQAGLLHLIETDKFRGIVTHSVHGSLPIVAALKIFLANTGITFKLTDDQAHVDFDLAAKKAKWSVGGGRKDRTEENIESAASSVERAPADSGRLSTVNVTGTLFRDWFPAGAHVIVIPVSEIQDAGFSSIGEFLRTLPQTFGSGPTPDTHLGIEAGANTGMGTAINLRGLGARATLILVNGKRLAPSGSGASYTDVSNIPLCAIDRIEILPDSAAATYGSDAVGGVINIRTRDATQLPITNAQWSSVAAGSEHAGALCKTANQNVGFGNLTFALGGSHQTPLSGEDRSFYAADLRYRGGPNLNLLETYPPVLSSLDGTQNWHLSSTNIPYPTLANVHPGLPDLGNRYQTAQMLASQDSLNAYARLTQKLGDFFSLSIDAFVNRRRAAQITGPQPLDITVYPGSPYYLDPQGSHAPILLRTNVLNLLGPEATAAVVTVYNLSIGAVTALGANNILSISLHRARERETVLTSDYANLSAIAAGVQSPSSSLNFNPYDQSLDQNYDTLSAIKGAQRYDSLSQIDSVSVSLKSMLGHLPSGSLQLTSGGEFRSQTFFSRLIQNDQSPFSGTRYTRQILAGFVELTAPLVSSSHLGLKRVDVSVSARHDDYSDFGVANTPRGGLQWALTDWLTLEGSYGYSFRAPDPGNLDQSGNSLIATTLPDPNSSSGQSRVLLLCCNNPGLRQEHAVEKTLGLKARYPLGATMGLETSLNYFAVRLKNRVEAITYSDQLLTDSQYAYAVTRSPTAAELQAACSTGRYLNAGETCLSTSPAAIVDLRLRNVSVLETQGVDFDIALKRDAQWGAFTWRTNGTYLLQYSEVPYPGAAAVSRLNTDHNPINLRLKNSFGWERGPVDLLVAMNFTNNYRDADSQPNRPIASFTTFDWQLKYVIGKSDAEGAIEVATGMQNTFNRAVPFLLNQAANVGYDQENFDPLGRVWFAKLSLNW